MNDIKLSLSNFTCNNFEHCTTYAQLHITDCFIDFKLSLQCEAAFTREIKLHTIFVNRTFWHNKHKLPQDLSAYSFLVDCPKKTSPVMG